MKRNLLVLPGFILIVLLLAVACTSSPGYPAPSASPSAPAPAPSTPAPSVTPPPAPSAPAAPGTSAPTAQVTLKITAENFAFDTKTLGVHMDSKVTLVFTNNDSVPHNVAIYTDSSATKAIFVGEVITGPKTINYTFDTPPLGTYFFRCDIHPARMTGTFTVVQ